MTVTPNKTKPKEKKKTCNASAEDGENVKSKTLENRQGNEILQAIEFLMRNMKH